MENLMEYFGSLAGLVALNVIVMNWVLVLFKISKNWLKQLLRWIVSVAEAIVGFVFSLGLFVKLTALPAWEGWLFTVLIGLGIGLVANGIYDIPVVRKLLESLLSLIKLIADMLKKNKLNIK